MRLSRLSFRWKAILGIALIEAVALSMTITAALGQMERGQTRLISQSATTALELYSTAIADALLSSDLAKIEAVSADLVNKGAARVVRVFDLDGRQLVAHGGDDDLRRRFDGENGPLDPDGIYEVSESILAGGVVIGRVEIGVDNTEALAELSRARRLAGIAALTGMCLAALFSWLLGAWLARSISALAGAAHRIAGGDLGSRAPEQGEGEVVSLARSFNHMAEALERREHEREALLERAEVAAEQARQADRAKSSFLAAMSHEIRTPLNGVIGLARIIAEESRQPAHEELVDQLGLAAGQLRRVVDDVLDFSKVEAGALELESTVFNPRHCLDVCVAATRVTAAAKGLQVIMAEPAELPPALVGDPTRLAQIVNNFLSNAVKFTRVGTIRLRAEARSGGEGRVWLHVEVEDSGPGIGDDQMQSLFEPFRQADASINRRHGGTGLGLSISRRFAEAMGGRVGGQNAATGGAVFWLEIPFVLAAAGDLDAREGEEDTRPARLDGLRVLVVDDNQINLTVAVRVIERAGAVVETASGGEAAVAAALEFPFDAILMDLQMPEVDGKRATVRILEALGDAAPEIIALTANALSEERAECLALGMADYLTKPVEPATLARAVRAAIPAAARPPQAPGDAEAAEDAPAPPPPGAVPEPGASTQELDHDGAIARFGHDEPLYREALAESRNELVDQMAGLPRTVDDASPEGLMHLRRQVHSLKGVTYSLGLPGIGDALSLIEDDLRAPAVPVHAVAGALAALPSRFDRARDEIDGYLNGGRLSGTALE